MFKHLPRKAIAPILVSLLMLIQSAPSAPLAGQALPGSRDAMGKLFKTLTDEAARRKELRYALIRNGRTEITSHLVRQDVLRTTLAYIKTVMLGELYLPHKLLGFYVGRGTSLDFVKFPPDQDVYIDPWVK
jgi:hypothetical protein